MREGMSIQEIYERTRIDPWFLHNIKQIIDMEEKIKLINSKFNVQSSSPEFLEMLKEAKRYGFSDRRIAQLLNMQEADIRHIRQQNNLRAVYKMVDTCAAEFAAYTPYFILLTKCRF
jgi:carbamoyl-phosphate synthase large subunit